MVVIFEKIGIGDVFEIKTKTGFAYFQARHFAKGWGHWICVFEGVQAKPLADVNQLEHPQKQFEVYFPLKAAAKAGIVRRLGNLQIGVDEASIPSMRSRGGVMPNGKVTDWWIISGEDKWRVSELTEEQKRFPFQTVVNDTALIEMIDDGWRPELDPTVRR